MVSKTHSFSKAAELLYVSQPNISSAITSLEKELGFQIFLRTNQGIDITSKGMVFLQHARKILDEFKKIQQLEHEEYYNTFSIQTTFNHTATSLAFIKLCKEFSNSHKLDFSLATSNVDNIINDLYLNKCQLGILLISDYILAHLKNRIESKDLELISIAKIGLNVNLRKDHPIFKDKPFNFSNLIQYPFVDYDFNTWTDYPEVISLGIVNPEKIIIVNERETRKQIVSCTDAFSIGGYLHPNSSHITGLVSIPLPNTNCHIAFIRKKNIPITYEEKRYTELLKAELEFLKF